MTITSQELSQKSSLIKAGMEFYIPGHDKSYQIKIVVSSVSIVKGTSCWGSYEETRVFYTEIAPLVNRKDKFNKSIHSMRIDSFVEYKLNKQIEESHA